MRKKEMTCKKLDLLNQTRKTSINVFTKTPLSETKTENKLKAFSRLEESRKKFSDFVDYDVGRNEAMNEKYGVVD